MKDFQVYYEKILTDVLKKFNEGALQHMDNGKLVKTTSIEAAYQIAYTQALHTYRILNRISR